MTANGKKDLDALKKIAADCQLQEVLRAQPSTRSEQSLTGIWESEFKKNELSIDDDFFELGGSSLTGIRLISSVFRVFGQKLNIRDIFQFPTIRLMAAQLDNSAVKTDGLVLRLNQHRPGIPQLFMIPPVVGSSTIYKEMAVKLNNEFNVSGLQYPGFDKEEKFENSIGSLAGMLGKEIIGLGCEETVFLAGYSIGALVAFEIAKVMEREGLKVKLILIDKTLKETDSKEYEEPAIEEALSGELNFWDSFLDLADRGRIKNLMLQNYRNMLKYEPSGKLKCDIFLLEAINSFSRKGAMETWKRFTTGKCIVKSLSASHLEIMNHGQLPQLLIDFKNKK